MRVKIEITKKDLQEYEKYKEILEDHPLYAHTSGLTRAEICVLGRIVEIPFLDNDTTGIFTIEKDNRVYLTQKEGR